MICWRALAVFVSAAAAAKLAYFDISHSGFEEGDEVYVIINEFGSHKEWAFFTIAVASAPMPLAELQSSLKNAEIFLNYSSGASTFNVGSIKNAMIKKFQVPQYLSNDVGSGKMAIFSIQKTARSYVCGMYVNIAGSQSMIKHTFMRDLEIANGQYVVFESTTPFIVSLPDYVTVGFAYYNSRRAQFSYQVPANNKMEFILNYKDLFQNDPNPWGK